MKKLLVFSFLLFMTSLQAQVRFTAGVGMGTVLESTSTVSTEFTGISHTVLNDSLMIKQFSTRQFTTMLTYIPQLEYSLFGDVDFRLSKRLEISTGLGFSFYSIDIERSSSAKFLKSEVLDTVPYERLLVSNSGCDSTVFIQIGGDVIKRDFRLLDLHIPLSIKYELFDGLKVNLGARLSTPVYSWQKGAKYRQEVKLEDGKAICFQSTVRNVDHSGDGIQQIRMSMIGGLHYRIFDNLEVNVLVAKSLSNVFNNDNNFNTKGVFKPLQIRLGASLLLGEYQSNKKNSTIE